MTAQTAEVLAKAGRSRTAAVYARVSTTDQAERGGEIDGYSLVEHR